MKVLKTGLVLLLTILVTCYAEDASAQIFRRRNKRTQKNEKPVPKPVPPPVATKKEKAIYPASKIKSQYRIDLLLPLYLNNYTAKEKRTFKHSVPERLVMGLDFYKGVMLAMQNNANKDHITLVVHDISVSGKSINSLLKSGSLDSSDLILGAAIGNDIAILADFAKKKEINFVSLLSPSDADVKNNGFFTIIQPSLNTHCEVIAEDINKEFKNQKIFIYKKTNSDIDEAAFKTLTDNLKTENSVIPITALPNVNFLQANFDSTEKNVIAIPVIEIGSADSLLKQLQENFTGYQFIIYGLPSWKFTNTLKSKDSIDNFEVRITSPYNMDENGSVQKMLSHEYKTKFGGAPSEWMYHGYEIYFLFKAMLLDHGTIFNKKLKSGSSSVFTKFKFDYKFDTDNNLQYLENKNLLLYRYQYGNPILIR